MQKGRPQKLTLGKNFKCCNKSCIYSSAVTNLGFLSWLHRDILQSSSRTCTKATCGDKEASSPIELSFLNIKNLRIKTLKEETEYYLGAEREATKTYSWKQVQVLQQVLHDCIVTSYKSLVACQFPGSNRGDTGGPVEASYHYVIDVDRPWPCWLAHSFSNGNPIPLLFFLANSVQVP